MRIIRWRRLVGIGLSFKGIMLLDIAGGSLHSSFTFTYFWTVGLYRSDVLCFLLAWFRPCVKIFRWFCLFTFSLRDTTAILASLLH